MTTNALLEVCGLRKTYGGHGREVEALRDITLSVGKGEFLSVVGPSGCGKTTLLKCIAGLIGATDGSVVLDGEPVTGPSAGMGVVFQDYGRSLFPWMSVRKNVELPLRHKIESKTARAERVSRALEAVGLPDAGSAYPWQLSGGMQQRVAIARALAFEPLVLLMDEPFAAVDAQTREDLEDLVRSLWAASGVTVLLVTHDIDEAVYLGDRVAVLSTSPTTVKDDVVIDLPVDRDQGSTRTLPRFAELRTRIYNQIRHPGAERGTGPVAR